VSFSKVSGDGSEDDGLWCRLGLGIGEVLNGMAIECRGITLSRYEEIWTFRYRPRGTSDARTLIQQGVPSAGGVHCAAIVSCDTGNPYNVREGERLKPSRVGIQVRGRNELQD
jgi:hypothetical protein